MKSNTILLFMFFAVFFTSCQDELNIEPKQREDASVTLSTEEGVTNVLTGTYALAARGNAYGGRILVYADLLGATGATATTEFRFRGSFGELRQMYIKQMLADNVIITGTYSRCYEIVNATNTVIDNISKVKDPAKQARMIGEANFLRSLAYFDLVRFFAKPYVSGQANNQLGIVIRDKAIYDFNADLSKERSTVAEVYKVIIDGLNLAYTNLPKDNSFYADKYAAKALLARVYLQQGNYALARDAADDVIKNSGHSLSTKYADAFNHDTDQAEDVFAIQITKQTGVNDANTFYSAENNGGRGGDIAIRDPYLEKFTDPNDDRAKFNYVNPVNDRILTLKFTDQFANVGIIRLAEMYLIRAEANFRAGTVVGNTPIDDINIIRTRANAQKLTAVTLDAILLERQFELAMEGFSIHDIRRTKGSIDVSVDGDGSELLSYDADVLVFPIPILEMDANKKITQNPGYSK
ncbi:RagB/SusD family nutrient uptake outer membrane protein [Flavobacterium tructae]|uniref:RagB/SusD family nutrient uptake outer membrane protein n=1 Tax=Flavobacterium tructae TaxID=1114873 RepID=A0A1S1J5T5_9FLAO|nr:RagB/SusD family nutrient uptake outer membrane protein [Flavobacterium tructae]OHT44835.1 RagB/SusD family protein [Flavobacterium tructae]OXB14848.1 RagB/SusD family nutrient uptake outer membrane protein [Flavobacterium tructae]OXB24787.1 RagB/SusD family nutrient uptake outer membrane protein [Flavobacterium tructae]